jgi:hypothetical protein
VIKKAISNYEAAVKDKQVSWAIKNPKPAQLSKALAKALGALNSKGLPPSEDKQVSTWHRHLIVVQKKLRSTLPYY